MRLPLKDRISPHALTLSRCVITWGLDEPSRGICVQTPPSLPSLFQSTPVMAQPVHPWTESFTVRSYEVTPHGRAALRTLCNYFQEVAGNHAQELGLSRDAMLQRGTAWVLARLRVQVQRYPAWEQTVQVETWPSGVNGLYATREFLLQDRDGSTLATGTSAWAVIDVERRRPVRIPEDVYDITPPDRPRPLAFADRRVPTPDRVDHARRFDVRFSDLDVNQHVNNARYVEWALEAAPSDILMTQQPTEIDIHFRAETTLEETVVTQLKQEEDRCIHRVQRARDEETVALATTRWTPVGDDT